MDHKAVPHTPNGIILTCMDSRVSEADPHASTAPTLNPLLSLQVFPEAAFNMTTTEAATLVMRNAGGRAQDMVSALKVSRFSDLASSRLF